MKSLEYDETNYFIFALLCTLQAQASVQPVQKDTVRHTIHYEVAELLQPMQPVYLNGVLLPASRTGNWFVSISGGATVFLVHLSVVKTFWTSETFVQPRCRQVVYSFGRRKGKL